MNTTSSSLNILPVLQPDLSHLSENERKIIEAVLERQKLEEEKNFNVLSSSSSKQNKKSFDSINNLKVSTTHQSITDIAQEVKQKYSSDCLNTGDFCDICKKTKFINNNNAHLCVYCKLKCCLRCSFKLKTKTKQLWACSECKLKQDTILKSKKWIFNNNSIAAKFYASDYLINNKTSKLVKQQNSFENSEDENLRFYDKTQLKRNLTISGDNYNNETMQIKNDDVKILERKSSFKNQTHLIKQVSLDIDDNNSNEYSPRPQIKKIERLQDPSNLFKKKPENTVEESKRILPQQPSIVLANNNNLMPKEQLLQKQYSSSSSSLTQASGDSKQQQQQQKQLIIPVIDKIEKLNDLTNEIDLAKKLKLLQYLHTDSLSSDPSDSVSQRNSICLLTKNNNQIETIVKSKKLPSIISEQQKQKQPNLMSRIKRAKTKVNKQYSFSSSDECEDYEVDDYEIHSTTEYNEDYEDETNDEMEDLESGSISDKGAYLMELHRKEKEHEKEEILAEKMKKFLSPITWKISSDRKRLIGHIIFKKNLNDPNSHQSIGIKIVSSKKSDGSDGTFIDKIKKGSLCDTIYHLKPGDELIEWNQTKLRNLSINQVTDIMMKSRLEPEIEIIVERYLSINLNNSQINELNTKNQTTLSNFGKLEIKLNYEKNQNKLKIKLINLEIDELIATNTDKKYKKVESVYFEFYLFKSKDETGALKLSDIIKLDDKNNYSLNAQQKLIIYDNILINDLKNSFIKMNLLDNSSKTILGKSNIELSKINLSNEAQILNIVNIASNHINESSSENLSATNSSIVTPKRRQLPQIPQLSNKEKEVIEEKTRKLKAQYINFQNNSLSDNETKYIAPKTNKSDNNTNNKGNNSKLISQTSCEDDDERCFNLNIKSDVLERKIPIIVPIRKSVMDEKKEVLKKEDEETEPQRINNNNNNNSNSNLIDKIEQEENLNTSQHQHQSRLLNTFRPIVPARKISPSLERSKSSSSTNAPERLSIMRDLKKRSLAMSNSNTGVNKTDNINNKLIIKKQTNDFDSDDSEFSLKNLKALEQQQQQQQQQYPKTNNLASTITINTNTNTKTSNNNITVGNVGNNKLLPSLENDKKDGTLSDSALTNPLSTTENNKKRRPSMAKALVILGLSKKSNSTNNITINKRLGFARSEEVGVVPELRNNSIKDSQIQDSMTLPRRQNLWSGALKLPHEKPFNEFVNALGPGQKVGRQVLGSPCLGEIQMSLYIEKNQLTIEIIRAKNLKLKSGYRLLPAAYVKLYLFDGHVCIEKQKTSVARRTLDPMYQEVLHFQQNYKDKVLQITVWGDYGKLDRKVFMGISQVFLNDLNLSSMVIGWYKLYSVSSLIADYRTLKTLSQNSSSNLSSTESGYSIDSGSVKTTHN